MRFAMILLMMLSSLVIQKKQSKDLVISQEINISVKNLFLTAFTFMALGSCTEE